MEGTHRELCTGPCACYPETLQTPSVQLSNRLSHVLLGPWALCEPASLHGAVWADELHFPSCRLSETEQVRIWVAPDHDSQRRAMEDIPAQVCLPFCLF